MKEILKKYGFKNLRSQQELAIERIIKAFSEVDDVILDAPTGIGKSLIGILLGEKFYSSNYFILTAEKVLQDQYSETFTDLIDIRGKDNYYCRIFPERTILESPCFAFRKNPKYSSICDQCEYFQKRNQISKGQKFLTNYHYALVEYDYTRIFKKRSLVILDESHMIEDILYEYGKVSADSYILNILNEMKDAAKNINEIPISKINSAIEQIKFIQKNLSKESFFQSVDILSSIPKIPEKDDYSPQEIRYVGLRNEYERLVCKYENFAKNYKRKWILEKNKDGVYLIPYNVNFLFYIFKRMATKRLWMSATIGDPDVFAKTIGIKKYKYISLENPINVENRPIIYVPLINLNYKFMKENNFDEILPYIKQYVDYLQKNVHKNGIIFTGNYKISKIVYDYLKKKKYKVFTHNSSNRFEILNEFTKKGGILITSSLINGIDMKDDLSRWQIIVKLPFLSLQSNLIREKFKYDKNWYMNKTSIKLVQALGRSVRHQNDYCISVILDRNFSRIKRFTPKWFQKSIVYM